MLTVWVCLDACGLVVALVLTVPFDGAALQGDSIHRISGESQEVELTTAAGLFIDPSGTLSAEQVAALAEAGAMQRVTHVKVPLFGGGATRAIWVKLDIASDPSASTDWLLSVGAALSRSSARVHPLGRGAVGRASRGWRRLAVLRPPPRLQVGGPSSPHSARTNHYHLAARISPRRHFYRGDAVATGRASGSRRCHQPHLLPVLRPVRRHAALQLAAVRLGARPRLFALCGPHRMPGCRHRRTVRPGTAVRLGGVSLVEWPLPVHELLRGYMLCSPVDPPSSCACPKGCRGQTRPCSPLRGLRPAVPL